MSANDLSTLDATGMPPGLRGVVVANTWLGEVRGEEGYYHYRHLNAIDVADRASVEQVWQLLIDGKLEDGLDVGPLRVLPARTLETLAGLADQVEHPYQLLQVALPLLAHPAPPTLGLAPSVVRQSVIALGAAAPVVLGVYAARRLGGGRPVLNGDPTLSHAGDWYRLATGRLPDRWQERAISTYLAATVDHGFNASTFASRAVVSTGTDVASALMTGTGSLAGPLHGGAPALALEMVQDIGEPDRAARWVRQHIAAGDKIMGFGHAVYRRTDPRSDLLKSVAIEHGGELVDKAIAIEAAILEELRRQKPDAIIQTNVEYYAGIVLHLAGLAPEMFSPSFTVARIIGWGAHICEQVADNRIIRPSARYVGPEPGPLPQMAVLGHC